MRHPYRFVVLYIRMWAWIIRLLLGGLWRMRPPGKDRPASAWSAFFSWRNPIAIFLGCAITPTMILTAEGCSGRRAYMFPPPPPMLTVHALKAEKQEIILERNREGVCRLQLNSAPFEPLDIHLQARVTQRLPSHGELQVQITPTRISPSGEKPSVEVRLRAGAVAGSFVVQVQATDQQYKTATTTFEVKVH